MLLLILEEASGFLLVILLVFQPLQIVLLLADIVDRVQIGLAVETLPLVLCEKLDASRCLCSLYISFGLLGVWHTEQPFRLCLYLSRSRSALAAITPWKEMCWQP